MAEYKQPYHIYLFALVYVLSIVCINYCLDRTDVVALTLNYSILFGIYIYFLTTGRINLSMILGLALLSRLVLLISIPNLSDDFYRFIWDGRLLMNELNPFSYTPTELIKGQVALPGLDQDIYQHLNSPDYFTIYPPISQMIFWLSATLSPNEILGNVIAMRIMIIISDIGIFFFLWKILQKFELPIERVGIYALNPLVIIELTGNLHFEGIVLCFLMGAVWTFTNNRPIWSSIMMALSITTKLTPLMLLPALFRKLHWRQLVVYYISVGILVSSTVLVIFQFDLIIGMGDSLSLFFKNFEFNAGVFFVIRAIGFYIKGYDMVAQIGPALSLVAMVLILTYAIFGIRKNTNIAVAFITIFFIQLSLATTVHPWYVIPMVGLCCLTRLWFPVVWSALIFMTYWGYTTAGYEHPFWAMAIEYIIIIPLAVWELYQANFITFDHST